MNKNILIESFQDTLNTSLNPWLRDATKKAMNSSHVYYEGFVSEKNVGRMYGVNNIIVEENTAFEAANKYKQCGKVAVLNFANPQYPGGNVKNGRMTQEECLCRSSNLFLCLSEERVFEDYYNYHRKLKDYFFSDRIIYTQWVTVFKNDSQIPQILPQERWFQVDVISCSAPFLGEQIYINERVLKEVLKKRIKNIFEVAIENEVEVVILGAWGCGGFKNPPKVVAEAFLETIKENSYDVKFRNIVFAIKNANDSKYETFERVLEDYYGESTTVLDMPPIYQSDKRSLRTSEEFGSEVIRADEFKYFTKQFSILGDSISTLEGFNPPGYNIFYRGATCSKSGVNDIGDTWWGKVIETLGGDLLVNNSWSGSRVTKSPSRDIFYTSLFPSGCSDERTNGLHMNNVMPNVIIVYLGTNDWANGVTTELYDILVDDNLNYQSFRYAYESMLEKLKMNYPESEIWCCTLCESFMSSKVTFEFPHSHGGIHIEEYNEIIRDVVAEEGCNLIDLYKYRRPYDSLDGSHPTEEGMNTLAMLVVKEMLGDRKKAMERKEYVIPDPERTIFYFTNKIRLYLEGKEQTVIIEKDEISVGRGQECTLRLDGKEIARVHGIFTYEDGNWFISDNSSANGTWLNGVRLEPWKMYQLFADDVINFAQTEHVVFFKTEKKEIPIKWMLPVGDSIGKIIHNKYKVLQKLNMNRRDELYIAENIDSHQKYVLKFIAKNDAKYNDIIRNEILREASMMMRLNHPGISQIIDIIDNQNIICVVREYMDGQTLQSIVESEGAKPEEKVVDWAKQICNVLRYMHSLTPPHIHRDIKPSNIMLSPSGAIKVFDFGIARTYDARKTQDTMNLGTVGYTPPEQRGSRQTDQRSDIFALGMLMHHMVTGIAPNSVGYIYRPICEINPQLSKGLEKIINKCTAFRMEDRYQSIAELLVDLQNYKKPEKPAGLFGKLFKR